MKKYEVYMDLTVKVTVDVHAENGEQAKKMAMAGVDANESYFISKYDSLIECEVTRVNECEDDDDDDDDPNYPDPADSVDDDDPAQEVYAAYSKDMRKAVAYINRQMEQWELDIIRAKVNRNYAQHDAPSTGIDDHRIIDLLEEYGEDNDLPEGWYLDEYDADDIVLLIQFES